MRIRQLDLDHPRDVRQFIELPFHLYKRDSLWTPPLRSSMRFDLDRSRHPTYRHTEMACLVAEEDGRTLGRLMVFHNRHYTQHTGLPDAFFHHFECEDHGAAARGLFDAASDWARARGLTALRGPRDLIGATASGLLVDGFQHPPAMGVPYNLPYYDALLKAAGLQKDSDHVSGFLRGDHALSPRFWAVADKVKARRGLTVKRFTSKEEMRTWIPRVARVYQEGFRGNYGYYPMTDDEFMVAGNALIAIARPELMQLVLRGDEVVGFLFAYPNFGAGLRRARGRLWPLGWAHILWSQRTTHMLDVNGVGLLPAVQGLGANVMLYTELWRAAQPFGFEIADVVEVDEHNARSRADMEAIGVQWHKMHRTYLKSL
jgi:hypothetical protein